MGAALSRKILKRRPPGPPGMSSSATPISDEQLAMENPPKRRKCLTALSSSAASIFDEKVVTEILLRLPVRPVLRFRSVSKSWRVLIDSPEFIQRHMEQSGPDNSDSRIIIAESSNLYTIHDLDSKDGARAKIMNSPLKNGSCFMVGSARGVLCLGYSSGPMDEAKRFMMWNPSTSKEDYPVRVVESNSIELNGNDDRIDVVYGFGYDHIKGDYILVRIISISKEVTETYDLEVLRDSGEKYGFQLEIYSFRSNSWKTIMKYEDGRFPYYYNFGCGDIVFVDGVDAIHFLVAENRESMESSITRFDLGSESFSLLPMPERGTWTIIGLTSLKGRLCYSQENPDRYCTTDVWVMKDYGIKESWVKLVSIACNSSLAVDLLPIGYSQSGRKLLLASDDYEEKHKYLQCYDLENRSLERVTISGLPTLQGKIKGCVCSASLVSI